MAETTYFPRRLILGGAMISGVLLALAVHMLGARYGLDLGGLFLIGFAALFTWQIGGFVRRNRPRAYTFDHLPEALLP